MDKRGNSREPFDKVSLNVRTLQWPVVLEAKRMKWTVGCGGRAAGAGADYASCSCCLHTSSELHLAGF